MTIVTLAGFKSLLRNLGGQQVFRNLSSAMNERVKVQVKQGVVVGQKCFTPSGVVFHSFKGIPYSVPPIGELRFRSPTPLDHFEQPELDCSKERDVSHQRDPLTQQVVGSENCLFLNIYAPQTKETKPMPVMVYIHGGGFLFGSGNSDYLFPQRFMEEDVIVVLINYRLGPLGFLCLPEAGIYGNAGLKDQRLTLQWVQENISQFNGDPNNVTLFGESAGAASVHLHTYASHANKLFHKAIMQSGTANMNWVFQSNPVYKAKRLAELLGLTSTSNAKEILEFLQSEKVTANAILVKSHSVLTSDEKRRELPLPFKPVVEDSSSPDKFIDTPIIDILKTPNTLKMPIIMGYNSGEGMAMTINAIRKLEQIENDLERFVPRNLPLDLNRHQSEIKDIALRMRKFYFNNKKIGQNNLNELTDLLSDYNFAVDMQNAALWQKLFQPDSPLYFYCFDYVGGMNFYKYLFQFQHLNGACHGDELFYQFQMANDDKPIQKDDELCSKRLCRLWANFARHGKPTDGSKDKVIDFDWEPVRKLQAANDNFDLDYLLIGKRCEMLKNPDFERMNFWKEIYNDFSPIDYSRLSSKL